MEQVIVKQEKETLDFLYSEVRCDPSESIAVVDLTDEDACGRAEDDLKKMNGTSDVEPPPAKKPKTEQDLGILLPLGFLDPLPVPVADRLPLVPSKPASAENSVDSVIPNFKQFWKAGDYEGSPIPCSPSREVAAGLDHVRVHPKFLHSNATSHKWALGALAELLDNSLDEVCHGATYVNIDMLENNKDRSKMLLIEDNGGGMDPLRLRQCMSLGYSAKSKSANTIGQYGNGFKTSTMRLGADVIVFSRCRGKDGQRATQSIGLLSYTFLRCTGKEDIVVPMLDYEKEGQGWRCIIRSSQVDWNKNLDIIVRWSPFYNEEDLLKEFNTVGEQGTRIIIYNLWEDDQGELELDFSADKHDIQIRGVNRDEKKIQMAQQFPNSRHFLTYRHSLRSYVSILYLRLPPGFRIIIRGKDVEYHSLVDDMMLVKEITYRPQSTDGVHKDTNMVAVVTIGFVKDAKDHIDVQGFNVYHKNRLIKPFWRVWNAAGSDGRGVIGVLEANFVEPAHDKQGFERTTVLQRLETKLIQMQKSYWSMNCHKIGYAPRNKKNYGQYGYAVKHVPDPDKNRITRSSSRNENGFAVDENGNVLPFTNPAPDGDQECYREPSAPSPRQNDIYHLPVPVQYSVKERAPSLSDRDRQQYQKDLQQHKTSERTVPVSHEEPIRVCQEENLDLREKNKLFEARILELENKLEEANKEQEALIDIFSEERNRRDREEESLRKKLKDASATIQDLLEKVRLLERAGALSGGVKSERQ